MSSYTYPITVAVLIFPIIALLITIPYMIKQYHRYGAIPFLRSLIIYSFVLYLLTAYFMVILPIPSIKEVSSMTTPWMQLIPFRFIGDIILGSRIVLSDFSTYIEALKQPLIYTNLFNLLLTLPFGVYLRYYFKRSWWEVLLYSFLLSLFFEVTQLSGLYGIYPRPYRLFDVDDLIVNTTGAMIGYLVTPLFSLFLPSRERLDELSYKKGKRVSFSRRLLAYLIDYVFFNIILVLVLIVFNINLDINIYSFSYLFYFIISVILFKGKTLGKSLVKLKIVDNSGCDAKVYQLLIRYIVRFVIYFKVFDIIEWSSKSLPNNTYTNILVFLVSLSALVIFAKTIIDIITKKEVFVYEKVSKTKNASTVKIIKDKKKENDDEIKTSEDQLLDDEAKEKSSD